MRALSEAMIIFNNNLFDYKKLCLNRDKPYSNTQAFFLNLLPFGRHYGGKTGFLRVEKFSNDLQKAFDNKSITNSAELINFAINYQDKGYTLSDYIWKSIRETAGFDESHVNYLAPLYQSANSYEGGKFETFGPDEKESRTEAQRLINQAINGNYSDSLLKCLHNYLGLEINHHADFGLKLLNHLNLRMNSNKSEVPSKKNWQENWLKNSI